MHARRLIRWTVGLVGSAFLLLSLMTQWDDVLRTLTVPTPYLFLALALMVSSIVANGMAWSHLAGDDNRTRMRQAFYLSLPSKYIPGGFAQPISQVTLASGEGVAPKASVVYFIVHSVIIVVASATIGSGVTFVTDIPGVLRFSAVLSLALCLTWRPLLVTVTNFVTRLVGRSRAEGLHELIPSQPRLIVALLWTLAGIAMSGFGFAAISANTADIGVAGVTAAFSLAFAAGFLAVPFPAGVGVREAVLAAALPSVAFPTVIALSAIHRLITMVAELLVMLATRRRRPRTHSAA